METVVIMMVLCMGMSLCEPTNIIDKCRTYSTDVDREGNRLCMLCITGYAPSVTKQTCELCDEGCLTCTLSTSFCYSCKKRYYLQGISCTRCMDGCEECRQSISCTRCMDGFYSSNAKKATGECIKCVDDCKVCDNDIECSSCYNGYEIVKDSQGYKICKEVKKEDPSKDDENNHNKNENRLRLSWIQIFGLMLFMAVVGMVLYGFFCRNKSKHGGDRGKISEASFYSSSAKAVDKTELLGSGEK